MNGQVAGVRWLSFPNVEDDRGILTAIEGGQDIPFEIKRIFYMHRVVSGAERGGHAHRRTTQVAIAVNGYLKLELSDGSATAVFELTDPNRGLLLPPMTWTRLFDFTPDAVALILADTHYDRSQSLRDWESYIAVLNADRGILS